jgi:hypothetical protein
MCGQIDQALRALAHETRIDFQQPQNSAATWHLQCFTLVLRRKASGDANSAAGAGAVGAPRVGAGHSANGLPIDTTGSGPESHKQPIDSGNR